MTELFLAAGPTRYLGGPNETFALPSRAFIHPAGPVAADAAEGTSDAGA